MAVAERAVMSPRITFRGNLRNTRHGWLRLTPAYSVELVRELVKARTRPDLPVLDPFCGTGTTLTAVLSRRTSKKELYEYLVTAERD